MAELNALLIGYDLADDARRISNRTMSVGQHFVFEASLLRPLPTELFETGLTLTPRVDRYARVTVRQCHYSVPAHLIGHRVRGVLRVTEVRAALPRAHRRRPGPCLRSRGIPGRVQHNQAARGAVLASTDRRPPRPRRPRAHHLSRSRNPANSLTRCKPAK